jgi:hypothetical protein
MSASKPKPKGRIMQNITRTLTTFKVKAYDIVEDANGVPTLTVIAETSTRATSMTKAAARAALTTIVPNLPRGMHITWDAVECETYAMPLDTFLSHAILIKTEACETSTH